MTSRSILRDSFLALASLAAAAHAQPLDLRLTSQGCSVWISDGGPIQTIAPNTDVSNGYQISVQHPRGTSAASTLAVSRSSSAYEVRLAEVTTYYAAASVRPFVRSNLHLTLTAPRSARVRLDAQWTITGFAGQFGPSGSLRVGGQILTLLGGFNQGGASTTINVGPTAVLLELFDDAGIVQPVDIRWTLRFTPEDPGPCGVTPYGPACGAELSVGTDLLEPGRTYVDFTVARQPSPGLLIAGFQRQAIQLGPCTLLNEALVVLPIVTRFYFDPPTLPGFSFKLQGGTITGGQIVMSQGLDLSCR